MRRRGRRSGARSRVRRVTDDVSSNPGRGGGRRWSFVLRWLRCCCSRSGPSPRVPITRPCPTPWRSSGCCSPSSAARVTGSPSAPRRASSPSPARPGVFRATFDVPAGAYAYKVALNNSWDENYGAGGAPGGADIALSAPGGPITFTYDHATHVISDDLPRPVGAERGAHWLRAGVIAWDLPDDREGLSYRLHWAPDGGLTAEDGAIVGGSSFPLDARRRGAARAACASSTRTWPPTRRCASRRPPAGAPASCSPASSWWPPTTPTAGSCGRPGCRSPACSTTSTPPPPGSARPGVGGARGSRCGRRPPSRSAC